MSESGILQTGGPQAPGCPLSLQHAEDYVLYRRYEYYVLAKPTISDTQYDFAEKLFLGYYPDSPILNSVGSSNACDYPGYIRDGRRPTVDERRYKAKETTCPQPCPL